jgi:hypothetical protein
MQMENPIVQFMGAFALWSFTIGHGRLLLRRTKSSAHPHRVDVLFKDTGWICLPSSLENLTIREVPLNIAGALLVSAGSIRKTGRKLFRVTGTAEEGFVLAGAVAWVEDEGEYNDPSSLIE